MALNSLKTYAALAVGLIWVSIASSAYAGFPCTQVAHCTGIAVPGEVNKFYNDCREAHATPAPAPDGTKTSWRCVRNPEGGGSTTTCCAQSSDRTVAGCSTYNDVGYCHQNLFNCLPDSVCVFSSSPENLSVGATYYKGFCRYQGPAISGQTPWWWNESWADCTNSVWGFVNGVAGYAFSAYGGSCSTEVIGCHEGNGFSPPNPN